MGNLDKAKNALISGGKKAIEGFNHVQTQMSSLTKDQVKEIEEKRTDYYSKLDEVGDYEGADAVAITKMNEYAMDVYRAYLSDMSTKYLPIRGETYFSVDNRIRFFDITKWVIDSDEKNIEKLINVYQVLSQQDCSIALIYNRGVDSCRVTLAVANIGLSDSPDIADQLIDRIKKSMQGNFPGAKVSKSEAGSPLKTFDLKDKEIFY